MGQRWVKTGCAPSRGTDAGSPLAVKVFVSCRIPQREPRGKGSVPSEGGRGSLEFGGAPDPMRHALRLRKWGLDMRLPSVTMRWATTVRGLATGLPRAERPNRRATTMSDGDETAEVFEYDVFLSHSAKDKDVVRDLARRLRDDGLGVWFDEWEIQPGDHIGVKIDRGMESSRILVLVMSANAFASDWATLESHTFRFRDPTNRNVASFHYGSTT